MFQFGKMHLSVPHAPAAHITEQLKQQRRTGSNLRRLFNQPVLHGVHSCGALRQNPASASC
jgi:hypothetical protein